MILTDKERYLTGELIRGSVLIDLFKPTKQQDIFIKFKGEQRVPKRLGDTIDQRVDHDRYRDRQDDVVPLVEKHEDY